MLFREIITVSENHMKPIFYGQNAELNVKAGGTYSYHCVLKQGFSVF
jgi:hypothetical protein